MVAGTQISGQVVSTLLKALDNSRKLRQPTMFAEDAHLWIDRPTAGIFGSTARPVRVRCRRRNGLEIDAAGLPPQIVRTDAARMTATVRLNGIRTATTKMSP